MYDQSKQIAEQRYIRDRESYSSESTKPRYKHMSPLWVYWLTGITFVITHFFTQIIGRTLFVSFRRLTGGEPLEKVTFVNLLLGRYHGWFTWLIVIGLTLAVAIFMQALYRSQRSVDDAAEGMIEGDRNGAHIESPYVLLEKFDYVFDNKVWRKGYNKKGKVVDLSVTSIITHMAIADSMTVRGRDGNVRFDKSFMEELFDVANVHPKSREYFDSKRLRYNPKNAIYGKTVGDTLADSINNTAYVPDCEMMDPENSQDPGGIYIVSTAPENTIVVTETRGGKGQKYIEPIIDIWSRLYNQPNMVITDLKMELLRMSLRTLTFRGYNVKSLNLLVPAKTDAINFIGYAVDSAIRGDINEMEATITSIADIYFPKDAGNDNPMWQNAASAVFKRTIMGLIDYICEEVAELKHDQTFTPGELRQISDELYGKVTLFNAYRFVVTTSATQYTDPEFINFDKNGEQVESKTGMTLFFDATDRLYPNSIRSKIANNDKPIRTVADSERMLASIYGIALFGMIFFTDDRVIKLTSARPSENLDMTGFAFPRRMAVRFDTTYANKKSIINDVVKWSCYEDPEMEKPFLTETGEIDEDFIYKVGTIDTYGWADAVFKGIFPKRVAYIKLEVFGHDNGLRSHVFNFVFKKDYRKSYSGQQILNNPISHEPEVRGGTLSEYQLIDVEKRDPKTKKLLRDEYGKPLTEKKVQIVSTHNTVFKKSLILSDDPNRQVEHKQRIITDYDIHYSEKPTALFLVAPPGLSAYNKILLITLDLLYQKQTMKAYTTNSNQKPFYETKYLLDEFGNIKSEGKGVPELDSKVSAGLGQSQQFTLILQALKQLDALYGAEKAETIKGSVKKYMVMSTTDEDTINTLMGKNGEKIVVQVTSQTNDKPIDLFFNKFKAKGSVSETRSRDITNVLSKNDFLRLNEEASEGRAIVVTGNNPIVSAGPTILPMSYKLQEHRMGGRGDDISVQNPPTMASTIEFDPLRNIPDFDSWLKTRVAQAKLTPLVLERYKQVYGYTDLDLQRLNADVVAAEIMHGVNQNLAIKRENERLIEQQKAKVSTQVGKPFDHRNYEADHIRDHNVDMSYANPSERREITQRAQVGLERTAAKVDQVMDPNNVDIQATQIREAALKREELKRTSQIVDSVIGNINKQAESKVMLSDEDAFNGRFDQQEAADHQIPRYVDKNLSKFSIITNFGTADPRFVTMLEEIYEDVYPALRNVNGLSIRRSSLGPNNLYGPDDKLFVEDLGANKYQVHHAFLEYLISFDSWTHLANGQLESRMRQYMKQTDWYVDPNQD